MLDTMKSYSTQLLNLVYEIQPSFVKSVLYFFRRNAYHFNAAILITLLSGCLSNTDIDKPVVPADDMVSTIEVTYGNIEERSEFSITDKAQIEDVLSYIDTNLNDWYKPFDTYPSPMVSVLFKTSGNELVFILWLGESWVGGGDTLPDTIGYGISESSSDDVKNLKMLLGLGV